MKKKMFQANGVLVENGVRRLTRNVRRATHVVVSCIPPSSSAVPVSRVLHTNLKFLRFYHCIYKRVALNQKLPFGNLGVMKVLIVSTSICLAYNAPML